MNAVIKKMNLSHAELSALRCRRTKDGTYISYIRGNRCTTIDRFFDEVSASLQFPWYFGNNWSAFDECIQDLEDWIYFHELIVVFDDFNLVFPGDNITRTLLVEHLKCMVEHWKTEGKKVEIWLNN